MKKTSVSDLVGLGCVRGIAFGLALEAIAGIGIYAAWHLWRLIH